jgi:hypothetical protein
MFIKFLTSDMALHLLALVILGSVVAGVFVHFVRKAIKEGSL